MRYLAITTILVVVVIFEIMTLGYFKPEREAAFIALNACIGLTAALYLYWKNIFEIEEL